MNTKIYSRIMILILSILPIISWGQKINLPWKLVANSDETSIYQLPNSSSLKLYQYPTLEINIPLPNGKFEIFRFEQNALIPQALRTKFPEIASYDGKGLQHTNWTAKLSINNASLHIDIHTDEGTIIIQETDQQYHVFYKHTKTPKNKFLCEVGMELPEMPEKRNLQFLGGTISGEVRKTYRLALSCTYQYAIAVTGTSSPTKAQVFAAMVTTMNRVNGIYERELGVNLTFIPNNDTLIFITNSNTTFTNNNASYLLFQNMNFINTRIGNANYDIGHVFSTGGGGLAILGAICNNTYKAQGVTGTNDPYDDPFDVDYVAHEMGHQLGADHTFNRCDNEESHAAFEPGSGSTIMAYAGICGNQNLQNNSDDYFHAFSKKQIQTTILASSIATCGTTTFSSIVIDSFKIGNTYHIPANTPFELFAPDSVIAEKYNWYQWNLGNLRSSQANSATQIMAPTFRSYKSVAQNYRVFPSLDSILTNNFNYLGERLPIVTRDLHFILEVLKMDNNWGINRSSDDTLLVKTYSDGPAFSVAYPNSNTVIEKEKDIQIQWVVGNTDIAPISCNEVNIFLSRDGGHTISDTIALNILNTGNFTYSFPAHLPNINTYRIKIKCANNIFFDISNANFALQEFISVHEIPNEQLAANIFPNPTHDIINIALPQNSNYLVELSNTVGQKILTENFQGNKYQINTQSISKGIYIIQILDQRNGKQLSSKITIQ